MMKSGSHPSALRLPPRCWLAAVMLIWGSNSRADVIYSGFQNIAMPLSFEGVYLNIVTGDTATSQPADWNNGAWINPAFGGVYLFNDSLMRPVITGSDQALNLSAGTLVGNGSVFAAGEGGSTTHVGEAADQFHIGTPGYIGFQFEATTAAPTRFGWISLTINNVGSGTINGWAYEDAANSISIGNVVQGAPSGGSQQFTLSSPAGVSFTLGSAISETGGNVNTLVKTGTGTASLRSGQTYTGGTTVSAGTLNVNNLTGSATGSGGITIDAGAVLSGAGRMDAGSHDVMINGTVSVGDIAAVSPTSSTLTLGATTGGTTLLGASGSLRFDLFSGAGSGDNTSVLSASDLLILYGDVSLLSGASLLIDNPNNLSAWAIGDQWRIWDVTNAGTRTGSFALANIIAPLLGPGKTWDFDSTSGILSITPEPGRSVLLLLGILGMCLRRRRS
jgi:autotransporter-associated beta strand protein